MLRLRMRPTSPAVGVLVSVFVCTMLEITSVVGERQEPHKYTIDELLSMDFEMKDSGDLGMDPCKAGEYL